MKWHFYKDGDKPRNFQECFGIESRERQIVPLYWSENDNAFKSEFNELFYLGPFKDYDNYILAWIPAGDIIEDYFKNKADSANFGQEVISLFSLINGYQLSYSLSNSNVSEELRDFRNSFENALIDFLNKRSAKSKKFLIFCLDNKQKIFDKDFSFFLRNRELNKIAATSDNKENKQ